MSELKRIVSSLPQLTKVERQTLRQTLDFLDSTKGKTFAPLLATNDWLTPGILFELRRRGMSYPPLTEKRLNSLSPNYFADAVPIMEGLRQKLKKSKERVAGARLNHAELLSFGRTIARALAEYLQPVGPVGLKFMLNNVAKVPDALEASFPEYLASSMLWVLVGARTGEGNAV